MVNRYETRDVHIINVSCQECERSGLNPDGLLHRNAVFQKSPTGSVLEKKLISVLEMPEIMRIKEFPLTLLLLDENAVVIAAVNKQNDFPVRLDAGLAMSADTAGTNAFSLAAQYGRSCLVYGEDHYLKMFSAWISYAVPLVIGDSTAGLIGILMRKDEFAPPRDEILTAFTTLAGIIITACLENEMSLRDLDLLREYHKYERTDNGLIAIDNEYRVVCANRTALELLNLNQTDVNKKNIEELFGAGCRVNLEAGNNRFSHVLINYLKADVNCRFKARAITSPKSRIGWILEVEVLSRDLTATRTPKYDFNYIIGDNTDLQRCINLARVVAHGNSNVLITGESGTGKEVFAQAIHYASPFKDGPFVAINSSAIPAELMESELFGYTDGAFTGAKKGGMKGKFAQANNGTLFLDEIGDMPIGIQAKLLRVLQDRRVTPLGGDNTLDLDIRIISATNQKLPDLIKEGKFRSDLYYRLNVVEINIPPLRERLEDIPLLANYFLEKFSNILGKNVSSISPEAMEFLYAYSWQGNVRELENVIERSVNLTSGMVLSVRDLPIQVITEGNALLVNRDDSHRVVHSLLNTEKQEIIKALDLYDGNIKKVAQALGIGRTTLYRRIKDFDLIDYIQKTRKNQR